MGELESTRVDVGVLLDAARRCDEIADFLDGVVRGHLERLTFDGAVAGADHAARGEAVRRTVDGVVDQVLVWARATREIGASLASSGHRYAAVDVRGASRLG